MAHCDDFSYGISYLEQLQKLATDEHVSRDINSALNQLKSSWNDQDPTSVFEMLRGAKRASKGNESKHFLIVGVLAVVALVGIFCLKVFPPIHSAKVEAASGTIKGKELVLSQGGASTSPREVAVMQSAIADLPERSEEVFSGCL